MLKISCVDMRDAFFDRLYDLAGKDKKIMLLTADMGAKSLLKFKRDLPGQFINMGIAEQNMTSVSAGLSLGGMKVFIYTIIAFATLRCYEQIKVDLCCMDLPVTVVGVGPGLTYGSDGPTHHATSDIAVMRVLPEMTILNPSDPVMTRAFADLTYRSSGPAYVRIDKGCLPEIYDAKKDDFAEGLAEVKGGKDLAIISTGVMLHRAMEIAQELRKESISAAVVDLYRIKPLNERLLLGTIAKFKRIATLEENSLIGGIGSVLSEVLSDHDLDVKLKRFAVADSHCFELGGREQLQRLYGLDSAGIVKNILAWVR